MKEKISSCVLSGAAQRRKIENLLLSIIYINIELKKNELFTHMKSIIILRPDIKKYFF